MRSLCILLCLPLLGAEPRTLSIQPSADSTFTLAVEKTGLHRGKKHIFAYQRYRGTLRYDAQKPEASQVRFVVESASAVCQDDWVSEANRKKILDLALNDMMQAPQHPEITFTSKSIQPAGANAFIAEGDLTLRGLARPVRIAVTVAPQADGSLQLTGSAPVKLSSYGISPPGAVLGVVGTKDEMQVSFALRAAP
jgi:polyisoprenoid-binding protein YceI